MSVSTPELRQISPQTAGTGSASILQLGTVALVARQGIYDRSQAVACYELLYRRSEATSSAEVLDGTKATLEVITSAVLEIGLDRLGGDVPVHINFPAELLADGPVLPVSPDRVVIEVLEDVKATPEVIAGIQRLRERGHRIALDDFAPKVSDRALLAYADIVKIDISQHTPAQLTALVTALKTRKFVLVAERVETREEFEKCLGLGFDLFQGYFLQHPKIFSARPVGTNKLGALRLVAILQNHEAAVGDIEKLISQDVSLSYRVLRCINSSFYGPTRAVESVRQAIVMLGFEKLLQLCALVALRGLEDRPPSVFIDAMARARMCEKLVLTRRTAEPSSAFITGLFSTLDVLTGLSMAELLKDLPLAAAVSDALTTQRGDLGNALHEVIAFERGEWAPEAYPGIPAQAMQEMYLEAIAWAQAAQAMVSS